MCASFGGGWYPPSSETPPKLNVNKGVIMTGNEFANKCDTLSNYFKGIAEHARLNNGDEAISGYGPNALVDQLTILSEMVAIIAKIAARGVK